MRAWKREQRTDDETNDHHQFLYVSGEQIQMKRAEADALITSHAAFRLETEKKERDREIGQIEKE